MDSSTARELGKTKAFEIKSINDALSILNEAAKYSSDEVRSMINEELKVVREALFEGFPQSRSRIRELRDNSIETLVKMRERVGDLAKETSTKVNTSAHQNPWYFVGGAALIASLLGFYFGKKST